MPPLLLVTVQPFAYVVCNYACQYGQDKREDTHKWTHHLSGLAANVIISQAEFFNVKLFKNIPPAPIKMQGVYFIYKLKSRSYLSAKLCKLFESLLNSSVSLLIGKCTLVGTHNDAECNGLFAVCYLLALVNVK